VTTTIIYGPANIPANERASGSQKIHAPAAARAARPPVWIQPVIYQLPDSALQAERLHTTCAEFCAQEARCSLRRALGGYRLNGGPHQAESSAEGISTLKGFRYMSAEYPIGRIHIEGLGGGAEMAI